MDFSGDAQSDRRNCFSKKKKNLQEFHFGNVVIIL